MDEARRLELASRLVARLTQEREERSAIFDGIVRETVARAQRANATFTDAWLAFRALVNVREPRDADEAFLAAQDELLQGLIADTGIMRFEDATVSPCDERLRLWQGDITTLAVDMIVNAANSGLTGCWAPLHYCIDNAIHTFAGVQLRCACARLMEQQGHPEPTAHVKVTDAYNLPSRRIAHTVGPIADGHPTDVHRRELARCYEVCLDAAAAEGLHTVAFCCISTGVFGFPQVEAAHIAVHTVRAWLDAHEDAGVTVLFNTFLDEDERIYRELLGL